MKIYIPKNNLMMKCIKAPGGMSKPVAFRMPQEVYEKLESITSGGILTRSQVLSFILSSVIDDVELRDISTTNQRRR